MSLVSFVKIRNEDKHGIKQAILDSLDLIQYRFTKNIRKAVIKPNMCYYWDYSTGQTTDPNFVAVVIEIIRERISPDVNISIVESDASAMKCRYAFKFLGYEKIAKQYQVKLVNVSEVEAEPVKVKVKDRSFNFMIPKIIKNSDLRMNIPKIKYHELSKITCALKNTFGCNPYPKKFKYHPRLDETIVALNKIMKFNLCIVDGIIVPGSQPLKLGLVMAGRDPVAIDAAAAKIAGINPKSVRHIMLAASEGIGSPSFVLKGIKSKYFEKEYPPQNVTDKLMTLRRSLMRFLSVDRSI